MLGGRGKLREAGADCQGISKYEEFGSLRSTRPQRSLEEHQRQHLAAAEEWQRVGKATGGRWDSQWATTTTLTSKRAVFFSKKAVQVNVIALYIASFEAP